MDGARACRRSLRAACVRLLFGVAALACAFAFVPTSASARTPADLYGINTGGILELEPDVRARHLAAMAAGGLRVARLDAPWQSAEPEAPTATGEHRYDWRRNDEIAASLAAHGIRWYPILAYSAKWASSRPGDHMAAPADPANFAAYARAFAARYGENGDFWHEHPELPRMPVDAYEIWNEPNAEQFWPGQDTAPERYAELFVLTRQAIREVDAHTRVVVGGLLDANATDPNVFLTRMVRHRPELRRSASAVGYHPYHQEAGAIIGGINALRRTMVQLDMAAVPIEVSEVGVNIAWMSEAQRTETFVQLTRWVADNQAGVTRLQPFKWLNDHVADGPFRPDLWEHYWGMVRRDGTPLPSATAYIDAVRSATSGAPAPVQPAGAPTPGNGAPATAAAVHPAGKTGATDRPQARKKPLTKKQKRRIARRLLARKRRIARRMLLRKRRMARRVLQRQRLERRKLRRSADSVRR